MSEPFIGEIKLVGFNFAPRGYALCNGQILSIAQNTALFALIGTTFGGNGQTTFALPNLQGRVPVHSGGGAISLGEQAGEEAHTLTLNEAPAHAHTVFASANQATSASPAGTVLSTSPRFGKRMYAPPPANVALAPSSVSPTGGSQPHDNMQPYLVINFVIALQGIFPSRN
jgi:microcystin-dependent protein